MQRKKKIKNTTFFKNISFQIPVCLPLARESIKKPFISLAIPEKDEYLLISVSALYILELKVLYI